MSRRKGEPKKKGDYWGSNPYDANPFLMAIDGAEFKRWKRAIEIAKQKIKKGWENE